MLLPSIFSNTFDDVMDDFFTPSWSFPTTACSRPAGKNLMNVDIKETDDKYQLEMELPGYKKEDVKASLKDGYLTISAEHQQSKDEKDADGHYIRRERYYGSGQRSFYVGENLTEEDIKAKFEDGILKLDIPKKEAVKQVEEQKYIAIEG
ncbi:MAG: Hsp20/alpha crystallin family protein [Eubacterium sp.]|nr:Hsp20/alpha crystallin family protein [Eubacterium sp.]